MASPISFSGMATGMDTSAMITALVNSAKAPMNQLTAQKSAFTAQSKKLTDIKTKLTALQTAAKALDTKTETLTNKVTSSDEKILKATALGGASMGSYKVTVSSVAQAERTYSDVFSSDTATNLFGSGTLTLQVGTATGVDITVDESDTLSSLAKKINASGAEVSAGVFHDGSSYRLQVTGRSTGAANAITFTEGEGLTLGVSKEENEKQTAKDAVISVDNLEIKSSTNTITGAVPGVTLTVVDQGSSVIQVDRDSDALKTKLASFVTAYNDVMKALNTEFTYSGTARGRDSLAGDGTLHSLQSTLRGLSAETNENGESTLTTLASMGLVTNRDGTLTLDDAKFTKAVGADYEGVASLLAGRTDGSGAMSKIADGLDVFARSDGTLKTKIDNLATRNRSIDKQIDSMQLRLDKYESQLQAKFTLLEQAVSQLQSQSGALSSLISS